MSDDDHRSVYGTSTAKPDKKAGVEVGGGEKAATKTDDDVSGSETKPGSQSDSEHERRPEVPDDPDAPKDPEDSR